jgi:hypothetical protein
MTPDSARRPSVHEAIAHTWIQKSNLLAELTLRRAKSVTCREPKSTLAPHAFISADRKILVATKTSLELFGVETGKHLCKHVDPEADFVTGAFGPDGNHFTAGETRKNSPPYEPSIATFAIKCGEDPPES